MLSKSTAEFRSISYARLIAHDTSAIATLYSAAVEEGFFYLDLAESSDLNVLQDSAYLASTSETLFDLSLGEKMLYDTNKLGTLKNYGYKPIGRNTGVTKGRRDGHELFLVPRDVLFNLSHPDRLQSPAILLDNIDVLRRFAEHSHQVCSAILKALAVSTELPSMADRHRGDCSSTSTVALLKYPRLENEVDFAGHIAHTDVGSLTLHFCDKEGLQAMHPASGQWENVLPRPGHAVVNIGDSLHHLSKRVLRSAFHRVLPHTKGNHEARYSVIYFMRPEQTATFTDENEKEWKCIDWHTRKFNAFRADNPEEVQQILDGRV